MTIVNHDDTTQTITDYSASSQDTYTIGRLDTESYILSLPSNLTHNITVSRGDIHTFSLPCRVDSFGTDFSACVVDTTIPSWASVD